jgi:hypothetical protein
LDIKNQEALYWENINHGDVLWGMPVLSFNKRNLEIISRWVP